MTVHVAEGNEIFVSEDPKKPVLKRKISRKISYVMGYKGTGQLQIYYPHLHFEPKTFFALGSPIGEMNISLITVNAVNVKIV